MIDRGRGPGGARERSKGKQGRAWRQLKWPVASSASSRHGSWEDGLGGASEEPARSAGAASLHPNCLLPADSALHPLLKLAADLCLCSSANGWLAQSNSGALRSLPPYMRRIESAPSSLGFLGG